MGAHRRNIRSICLAGTAMAGALGLMAAPAYAQEQTFELDVPSQRLDTALRAFAQQSRQQLMFAVADTKGFNAPALNGSYTADQAIGALLAGTGLEVHRNASGVFLIASASDPQGGSAAGDGAEVEALIVTAQKREEDIQDVPIAMSAFTQEDLTKSQITGGPDLMTQVPNLTFTKTNFTSYSIQIRGIGTQAISATVDPAVAIAFNNTPFVHNRFFEQEFYDLNRVEVLRGPQGTLYGRNATAGVVNLITARPKFVYEAKLSADLANYSSTRLEGMVNLPLVEDKIALRLAGAWTKRDGFVTNDISGEQIDGRDLWSARATLRIEPTDEIRLNAIYEHFEEDDDRLRSGKQLCTRQESPTEFDGIPVSTNSGGVFGITAYTSQGCVMGSLYDDEAFQTPNGFALPYYGPLANVGLPINPNIDPYLSTVQSKNLRVIESTLQPVYTAKNDIVHLAAEWDFTPGMTLSSETAYSHDELFSFQDFNRFNTSPGIFNPAAEGGRWVDLGLLSPEGAFCDPQLGCADRLVAADVSTARSTQFSQELRLSSNFEGPFNFHVGGNFLRMDTMNKYYVFVNSLTLYSALWGLGASEGSADEGRWSPGGWDNTVCLSSLITVNPLDSTPKGGNCSYIDPNPIGSLNDVGRNYFLSKNPFRLVSYAIFGEATYNLLPNLKVTAGLRYTVDKKHAPIIPSRLLTGGYGMPVEEIIDQEWREPTGRLVIDWKPDLGFTDETMVYASYAHGYKAGGVNPPLPGALPLAAAYEVEGSVDLIAAVQPPEFGPEFIDAFEVGAKNTLLDGRLRLNANAFYYDYEGYQISSIVNRSAINLNFDAEVWGAELEVDWRPLENLKLGFKGGWEKTRVGEGQSMVDMIDRTAGMDGWGVIKPFPTNPSNCIFPEWYLARYWGGGDQTCTIAYLQRLDPRTNLPYVPDPQVLLNTSTGALEPLNLPGYPGFDPDSVPSPFGFPKDLGGNELPNAPDFTTTLTIDYTLPLPDEWLLTLHADLYRQSEAWARIFNEDPYDKIKPYTNVNFAAIFDNEPSGWKVMAYVKNVFDKDNITGAFLNSDDTGLTTNVFLNEPRLYGLRVTKLFDGGPILGDALGGGSGPYPWTVEIGAGVMRAEAPNEVFRPDFVDGFTSPTMPFPLNPQNADLDWGDQRDVKLTYSPPGSHWFLTASARFGRTNGMNSAETQEQVPGGCDFPRAYGYCVTTDDPHYIEGPYNYARTTSTVREKHTVVEFMVGADVGMGLLGSAGSSKLSAGLRYAQLDSEANLLLEGKPDYYIPWDFGFACGQIPGIECAHVTDDRAEVMTRRVFEGTGPVLAWDASIPLLGNGDTGEMSLTWSLSGGVLFGRQRTNSEGSISSEYFVFQYGPDGPFGGDNADNRNDPVTPPSYTRAVSTSRNSSVSVPVAGAALGLSYELQRIRIGAGYRWERYFDAIDGGYVEREQFNRTIDGPYFKLAIGFGG